MEILFVILGLGMVIVLLRKNARQSRIRSGWVNHKSELEPPKTTQVMHNQSWNSKKADTSWGEPSEGAESFNNPNN